MSFGSKLKELRLQQAKSLQQVADAVKASKAHIWELETGKSKNPSIQLVERLAEYFKVTVANLVGELPEEDEQLLVMFRDMKDLGDEDRQTVQVVIDSLKARRKERPPDEN